MFHHALINVSRPDGRQIGSAWPVHEVGRKADIFDSQAGKLQRAGSTISFPSVHLQKGQGIQRGVQSLLLIEIE